MGTRSVSKIAIGSGLPAERIKVVQGGEVVEAGKFRIHVVVSPHSSGTIFPGEIAEPLITPAWLSKYKEGGQFLLPHRASFRPCSGPRQCQLQGGHVQGGEGRRGLLGHRFARQTAGRLHQELLRSGVGYRGQACDTDSLGRFHSLLGRSPEVHQLAVRRCESSAHNAGRVGRSGWDRSAGAATVSICGGACTRFQRGRSRAPVDPGGASRPTLEGAVEGGRVFEPRPCPNFRRRQHGLR